MPNLLPFSIIFTAWFGSMAIAVLPFAFFGDQGKLAQWLTMAAVPLVFVACFPLITGTLSRFAKKGIKKGKFPREAMHPVYFLRRVYGACWTQLFYFKPVYSVVLALPFFKKAVFRLFGYKESTDFIVYPDTWIRDLPCLKIGKGAYLSNRATIGTNICLSDGSILVDHVRIEERGLVGHLAMLGPGTKVGQAAEIGVGCGIGIRANIKAGAMVKPSCTINHGAIIGAKADVGTMSYIGLRVEIGEGLVVPAGANIPNGAVLKTQEDVNKYYNSETERLVAHKESITQLIQKHATHAS